MALTINALRSILARLMIEAGKETLTVDPAEWKAMRQHSVATRHSGHGCLLVAVVEVDDNELPHSDQFPLISGATHLGKGMSDV